MVNEFNKSIELALADFEYDYPTRVQVFSFAWYHGKLLAMGRNTNKTHTWNIRNPRFGNKIMDNGRGSCAELILCKRLINKTRIPFSKITMVNVRLTKNKEIKNSKPCNSCSNLLTEFLRFGGVYHSTDEGTFKKYENL